MKKLIGGQAFPCGVAVDPEGVPSGMSLLDHYAGQAMIAVLGKAISVDMDMHGIFRTELKIDYAKVAEIAFKAAEAMCFASEERQS